MRNIESAGSVSAEPVEERILVIRASAMGDVALTVPVLEQVLAANRGIRIVFLTRKAFNPVIRLDGIEFFNPDFSGRHRGLSGIFRLWRDIDRSGRVDRVADLHDVLRSKLLRWLFRLSGRPVASIDKGRAEKRRLIRGYSGPDLVHVTERYARVFREVGLKVDGWPLDFRYRAGKGSGLPEMREGVLKIGIAPFAAHELKTWPVEHMKRLMIRIKESLKADIYLFGGGSDECMRLSRLAEEIPGMVNLCGRYGLDDEIDIMGRLDAMIAMDSANMHLAAMTGIPVVSVWGATHAAAGFYPVGDNNDFRAEIPRETLSCRPCTIYGKGRCRRGDLACLQWLTDEMVFSRLLPALERRIR